MTTVLKLRKFSLPFRKRHYKTLFYLVSAPGSIQLKETDKPIVDSWEEELHAVE